MRLYDFVADIRRNQTNLELSQPHATASKLPKIIIDVIRTLSRNLLACFKFIAAVRGVVLFSDDRPACVLLLPEKSVELFVYGRQLIVFVSETFRRLPVCRPAVTTTCQYVKYHLEVLRAAPSPTQGQCKIQPGRVSGKVIESLRSCLTHANKCYSGSRVGRSYDKA